MSVSNPTACRASRISPVGLLRLGREPLCERAHQRVGEREGEQVPVLRRATLVVEGIGAKCPRLDADDRRRAPLNDRDLSARGVEILRDVVTAIRADHERPFALVLGTHSIVTRVHDQPENSPKTRQWRKSSDAASARCDDDDVGVLRAGARHRLGGGVRSTIHAALVAARPHELGARPDVELHRVGIHSNRLADLSFGMNAGKDGGKGRYGRWFVHTTLCRVREW